MTSVPAWIQILQALLTPTIGIAVVVVGFLQWRTAHQKVVLDLFERRLAIIDAARNAAKKIVFDQEPDYEDAVEIATDAAIRSRFLFGSDIVKLIVEFRGDVHRATESGSIFETTSDIDRIMIAKNAARAVLKQINTLAEPYMRMDQRRVRTPAEWFHERNEIRKSYGDQPR